MRLLGCLRVGFNLAVIGGANSNALALRRVYVSWNLSQLAAPREIN